MRIPEDRQQHDDRASRDASVLRGARHHGGDDCRRAAQAVDDANRHGSLSQGAVMETVRNVSMQSLILQKPGGGNMHLLPGRAIGMTDQQLAAPQVQTLLNRGLLAIEVRLTEPATGTTGVAVTGLPETPVPPA